MNAKVVGPRDGVAGFMGSIGVRFMLDGPEAGRRFSLVEHPMSARALAAPLHRHSREDEYSFVIEGQVGALLGDEVLIGQTVLEKMDLLVDCARQRLVPAHPEGPINKLKRIVWV